MRSRSRLTVSLLALVLPATTRADEPRPLPARVEFNRDIRPILSDTCYTCHGPASSTRKADLRLDTRAGLFADLGGYRAIVPGKPGQSELLKRVAAAHAAKRMPPPNSGRQLTERQIALLRRWVEQGATWQDHWSFIPPTRTQRSARQQQALLAHYRITSAGTAHWRPCRP